MRTNYILVDFENVQPNSIRLGNDVPVKVFVFLGENQNKISSELAISLQALGENAVYVRMSGNGKNALDFHLAYWIGRLSEKDGKGYFHIVSKDRGFDPLIETLRKNKVLAQRVSSFGEIQILGGSMHQSLSERVTSVIHSLKARGNSRPRKRCTLRNTISAMYLKTLKDEEIDAIVNEIERQKLISFNEDVVTYHLSE